ncbi:hypothetical protein CYY_005432 [Polysphondylium violaceum]|uniref:Dynamin-type G domain-containing protein n=1 Tax=Polysphondylium violaceum TaxID=133409 RepID=A0A8J4PT47_9MYCE|nr:hypothetical protein CYY_005432 [Polysphondylium violaceum]
MASNQFHRGVNTSGSDHSTFSAVDIDSHPPTSNHSPLHLNNLSTPATLSASTTSASTLTRQYSMNGGSSTSPAVNAATHPLNKAQLAIAEAMALKMHEEEKRKRDEKKRKRESEEQWSKQIRNKIELERKKLDELENHSISSNKELYSLFNDLQMISHEHNISFDTPELVVVGMQSDGKSSFIESLLGFQFNIVETNIGTRRPLIIQMINNPQKLEPSCRFKKEIDSYDRPSSQQQQTNNLDDRWEEHETPVNELTEEIVKRTNEKTGSSGERVSAEPIFLRVEFAGCSNLNIYDTPGFRKGGDERLKHEIGEMVKKLIQPKNRIIVCLEQSNVEWANTISRPLVKKIDQDFSRTILISTKFDNRVKELRNRESAHKYLEGEGIVAKKKPFFISLPLKRNLEPHKFKEAMKDCFLEDYRKLLEVNIDEARFSSQIGIFKVRSYIENLLHEKYQQNLLPSMLSLESICKKTESDIQRVRKELEENNIVTLKFKVLKFVQNFNNQVERLLEGSVVGEPDEYGQTLQQEKENCSLPPWPAFNFDFNIQNSEYNLYGGAQYERLLNEFEYVIHSKEFPETSINEVASAIGVSKSHNSPTFEVAATNIFQIKSKKVLLPLMDILLQRCSYIMKRLFDISVSILKKDDSESSHTVSLYDHFLTELKAQYHGFVESIEVDCRNRLRDDFDMFTKIVDWNLLNGLSDIKPYNYLNITPEETKQRVVSIMEGPKNNHDQVNNNNDFTSRNRCIDDDSYQKVCMIAGRLFSGIRFFLSKIIRNKLNAFFLDPIFQKLGGIMIDHFSKLSDQKYEEMFQLGIKELESLLSRLEAQLIDCQKNRDKFKEVYNRMKQQNQQQQSSSSPVNVSSSPSFDSAQSSKKQAFDQHHNSPLKSTFTTNISESDDYLFN